MHRARLLRRLAPLALLPGMLLASSAEAGPPQRGGGFDEGAYIQGSPGAVALKVGGEDIRDLDVGWPWALGGGYLFARGPLFKATLGGAFEHHLLFLDNIPFSDVGVHSLHALLESRIGAGSKRVWGYGLLGLGPGVTIIHIGAGPFDNRNVSAGIDVQLGGGVQGIVYRNLFLGGEIDVDLGFYFDADYRDGDFSYHMMTLKFLLGWYF